jgi:hypothetical protein
VFEPADQGGHPRRAQDHCSQPGAYRRDGLMARFGPDAALPDVLMALASCERRRDFSRPHDARYADLAKTGPDA